MKICHAWPPPRIWGPARLPSPRPRVPHCRWPRRPGVPGCARPGGCPRACIRPSHLGAISGASILQGSPTVPGWAAPWAIPVLLQLSCCLGWPSAAGASGSQLPSSASGLRLGARSSILCQQEHTVARAFSSKTACLPLEVSPLVRGESRCPGWGERGPKDTGGLKRGAARADLHS